MPCTMLTCMPYLSVMSSVTLACLPRLVHPPDYYILSLTNLSDTYILNYVDLAFYVLSLILSISFFGSPAQLSLLPPASLCVSGVFLVIVNLIKMPHYQVLLLLASALSFGSTSTQRSRLLGWWIVTHTQSNAFTVYSIIFNSALLAFYI